MAFWVSKTGQFNQGRQGSKAPAVRLLALGAAAAVLLVILVWRAISFSDGSWSLAITDAALPWVLLLGGLTLFGLMAGVRRRPSPAVAFVAAPDPRLIEALRSGAYDLAQAQRMAAEVVAALPDPLCFRAADGRHIGVDEAWQKLFGVSRTVYVRDLVNNLHARGNTMLAPAPAVHTRRQTYQTTITTAGGERIDTICHTAPLAPAHLGAGGLIGSVINSVESREAGLCNMLGYAKQDIAGLTLLVDAYGEDQPRRRSRGTVAQCAVIALSTELLSARDDGSFGWDRRTVSVVCNLSGRPDCLTCSVEDVTVRKLDEQRHAMERAINRVLTEFTTVADAMPQLIESICLSMEWRCGTCWVLDRESGDLWFREAWGFDVADLQAFLAEHVKHVIKPEPATVQGLVQRSYLAGRPVWITDLASEPGLAYVAALGRAGVQGAFGFPLMVGNKVLGAMVFFHCGAPAPTAALLTTVHSIGSQIGQYVARLETEDNIKIASAVDPLTQLPNREVFRQRLQHAFAQSERRSTHLAVMLIDLDHFKVINDTLGHEAGDTLLLEVAQRLRGNLRVSDTVARLGGDEFVVLIEDVDDPFYVGSLARKLIDALTVPYIIAGRECRVTASIGSSAYPDDGEDTSTLLKNADAAMYRAKESGRNSFQFFSEQMNANAVERMSVEVDLRHALERDEMVLHYQPKIDVRSGRVTGLEALVRWQHPELGLVPPAHFMQVANETGLIVPISEWVLKSACITGADWARHGLPNIPIAVNLSRRQFMHGNLIQDVNQVLEQTGCSAECIALEITESMVMHDPVRAIALISELKRLGLQVVIDDFGTGYSSLTQLPRFQVDALKIDRSFIKSVADGDKVSIAQAIIAMAHNLKFKVIAEGVETRQQFDFLCEHDCDEIQGYYVSKPLAQMDAVAFMQNRVGNSSSG